MAIKTISIIDRAKEAVLDTGTASAQWTTCFSYQSLQLEKEIVIILVKIQLAEEIELSGFVLQICEYVRCFSQHPSLIRFNTVFRGPAQKVNLKCPASLNPLGHYSAAGETAWICCR